ncbi:diguanylate cyclase (GGDEF)-like protein [Paraburkholderia sp. MM5496-R1]
MAPHGLSLRHRLRLTLRAVRAGMTRYVGNRPWVAGVAGTLVALAMSILTAVEVGEGRKRARRDNKPLSVLFIDIDHFKRFNDTYGHESGDEVWVAVADCIASVALRSADLVARYGGEEFAVVLPDTTAQGAFAVAEQIRRKVENQVIVREHDAPQAVTVSVGCATALPSATDVANGLELMAAADGQLYVAKNEGRNRTRSAQWDEDSATQGVSRTGAAP